MLPPRLRLARALAVAAAAALLAACRDSTAPKPSGPLAIAVTAVNEGTPHYFATPDSFQEVECRPRLRAIATGGGTAQWDGAKIRWYLGSDRTTPVDSTVYSGYDIRAWWGKALMSSADTATSDWQLWAGLPFTAEFVFEYSSGTRRDTATVRITCGPEVTADVARPVVDMPTLVAPPGDLEPGDTVQIQYSASAAGNLWESEIGLGGACDTVQLFPEQMRPSVTRTVTFVIPPSCHLKSELGSPELSIVAAAFDAGGRGAGHVAGTGRWIVDLTPPRIQPYFYIARAGYQWFVGDTLDVTYDAEDNHGLATVFWQEMVSGTTDSIAVSGLSDYTIHAIPIGAPWVGSVHFRVWARDLAGLTSDTVTMDSTAAVYPTVARATHLTTVPGDVEDVAYDAPRQRLYLAQANSSRIAFLSLASMTITRYVDLPSNATSVDLTASGDSLVVAMPAAGELEVIDLRDSTVRTVVPITAIVPGSGQGPQTVRVLANGEAFVALGGAAANGATSVVEVDLATGVERVRTDANRGSAPATLLQRSADRGALVLGDGCLQRYDVASDAFTPCRSDAPAGWEPVSDGTGSTFATGLHVYDASLAPLRVVTGIWGAAAPTIPLHVALSLDGSVLYVAADPTIGMVRARINDGVALDRTPDPGIQPNLVRASDDGKYLFFVESNYGTTSKVAVMDIQ